MEVEVEVDVEVETPMHPLHHPNPNRADPHHPHHLMKMMTHSIPRHALQDFFFYYYNAKQSERKNTP